MLTIRGVAHDLLRQGLSILFNLQLEGLIFLITGCLYSPLFLKLCAWLRSHRPCRQLLAVNSCIASTALAGRNTSWWRNHQATDANPTSPRILSVSSPRAALDGWKSDTKSWSSCRCPQPGIRRFKHRGRGQCSKPVVERCNKPATAACTDGSRVRSTTSASSCFCKSSSCPSFG